MLSKIISSLLFISAYSTQTCTFPKNDIPIIHSPYVFIISMADFERDVWIDKLNLTVPIPIPGLSYSYPLIYCNHLHTICQITTGEGLINAAASTNVCTVCNIIINNIFTAILSGSLF